MQNYKSLENVEFSLPQVCVLFGPNAAGKSNFLDALQLIKNIATCRTLKDAFDSPYRGSPLESITFPQGGVKQILKTDRARIRFEIDVTLSETVVEKINSRIIDLRRGLATPSQYQKTKAKQSSHVSARYLRYSVEVEILTKSGTLRIYDEEITALNKKGFPTKSRAPFLQKKGEELILRMERQARPTHYTLGLDHSILSEPLYPPHYPHLVALREELASWHFFYFEPRERMRSPNPVREVRNIGLMGEDLANFLNTLMSENELQFRSIERSLHMLIPSITAIRPIVNDLGQVELNIYEGDTPIPATLVSEGTLRILGLLALQATKEPPTLIGLEEPENGVHPQRIRLIAELLKRGLGGRNTQLICTTHSPILPDMMDDENLFVCTKSDGRTAIERFLSWGPLARYSDINKAFESSEENLPVETRLLRGDFNG